MKPEEYIVKPCELGKDAFTEEQPYTVKCEVCNLFVKIPKYRSCPKRIQAHLDKGEDILAPIREHARISNAQLGLSTNNTGVETEKKPSKQRTRRGR